MECEERQLFCSEDGLLAMHEILEVGVPAQCEFSLQSFITGIRRGVGTTVLCGLIHALVLRRFSNSYWV